MSKFIAAGLCLLMWVQANAETPTVVVTGTRVEQPSFAVPMSIDAFGKEQIQNGQAQVNLSESVGRAPGVVANNRQNYAQDLQISIRGFGARSTFGIRGVRLYADGIPLTMPDGQGQAANVDLSSARQIEVMRGPFSALYGNSFGGVINAFTEEGPEGFGATGSMWAGAFDSSRLGLKLGGQQGRMNYLVDASRFDTDGFRDHSATTRNMFNGKLRFDLSDDTHLTWITNYLDQPDTQDPLGLTRDQMHEDREQAGTGAVEQDTRKSIENAQTGVILEHALSSADSIQMLGYYGERNVRQFLALIFPGRGVVDLDRYFDGAGVRWTRRATLSGKPFIVTAGVDYDRMHEVRKGFTNDAGQIGDLGRNEDDTVDDFGPYAQAQWDVTGRLSVSAGVRHSRVRFKTEDHFITDLNGDDSGRIEFSDTLPVAGVLFKVNPTLNLYANAGDGFETPTFSELAYQSVSASDTGLNFDLKPAESRNFEAGLKVNLQGGTRLNAAWFKADVHNEIVVLINQGGRSVFQNVDHTRREGVELAVDHDFERDLHAELSYTYLNARFESSFKTCGTNPVCAAPDLTVPSGNRIPGVPSQFIYGELSKSWSPLGLSTALEARWMGEVFTNDLNEEAANGYALVNWRVGLEQDRGDWKFREFLRVDNILDREYVGSVIVNASGGQYYEPAPGRAVLLGFSAAMGQ